MERPLFQGQSLLLAQSGSKRHNNATNRSEKCQSQKIAAQLRQRALELEESQMVGMKEVPPTKAQRPRGRPRAAGADEEILQATLKLGQELGFDALSMEGIAARAGVAKTTIYRRWRNVSEVVMDAFLWQVNRTSTLSAGASARESFRISMKRLARAYRGKTGRLMRTLVARAQSDPKLLDAISQRWVEPRREIARGFVRAGIERGELRAGIDPDIVLDALYGPFYHRILVPYVGATLSDEYVETLVDLIFNGLVPRSSR
jgi:AcrR family transcriptional regulator